MLPVVTAAEMRALEARTIADIGLPGVVLMDTAGRKLAGAVMALEAGADIAVVCGGGNNGGDGFVCARVLREHGATATVYLAVDTDTLTGDAAVHFRAYREAGGVVVAIADTAALETAEMDIHFSDVLVDALLGTGLDREVKGHFADIVEVVNEASAIVVAADVPSGLNADTGVPMRVCVAADLTVTMAFAKRGLVGEPGFAYVGDLHVVEIGIPSALGATASVGFFQASDADEHLPWPEATDHKNRRGSVLVLAGSPGRRGAARLAARAALRVGAGLVTWASPSSAELSAPDPIMTASLDRDGDLASWLPALLLNASAVVIGPGMPADAWGQALLSEVLTRSRVPVVIDADGLGHLASDTSRLHSSKSPVVLTPHPGEAGRLLGVTGADIQSDRLGAARAIAALGAVCVLKGARTIVDDGHFASINSTGNAGMATAGSGDVLAGVIGGLVAQGLEAIEAARVGVYLHGLAGDCAASELGPLSLNADDLVEALPAAIGELIDDAD